MERSNFKKKDVKILTIAYIWDVISSRLDMWYHCASNGLSDGQCQMF